MGFTEEHFKWINFHKKGRSGERLDRLVRGHGHGEKLFVERVWWPIFGHMDDLHPEYEVSDWRGRPYFVDFVWKRGQIKVAIEVKGYGPHVQQMDRTRYRQELNRETYLQIAGYQVVAVPYDDLESAPDLTISLFKSLLAPTLIINADDVEQHYTRLEKEIMRIAVRWDGLIRPADLANGLGVDSRTIRKSLSRLCERGKLRPVPAKGSSRVCRYECVPSMMDSGIW